MDESQNEEKSIASLLHKVSVIEGVCLYTFVNIIIGQYDPKTMIFTDNNGHEYNSTDSDFSIYGTSQFVCGNVMKLEEAYETYLSGKKTNLQKLVNETN